MTINGSDFWRSNYYKHPPLTDAMILLAEAALAVRLPRTLLDLLRIQNGGYTNNVAHPMRQRTTWAEDHVPLHELFGIVTEPDHKTAQNMLLTEYMTKEWGLPPRQVLLAGDGHYWVTLDYRCGAEPSVAWIDTECGEDMQIAPSFDVFLPGLVPASIYDEAQ